MYHYFNGHRQYSNSNLRSPQHHHESPESHGTGQTPLIIDIDKAILKNNELKSTLWSGNHLQATLMSIPVSQDLGLNVHHKSDLYLRIEKGEGKIQMGNNKDNLYITQHIDDDFAVFIPAGTWFNVSNIDNKPLKLYIISAPIHH